MTLLRPFLALVLVCGSLAAQGTRYNFITLPVPPVTSGSASVVGEPGSVVAYYWIVAKYTGGNASPYGPITVSNMPPLARLGLFQYSVITWDAVSGVTGYDVLRTTTPITPSGACNCAVVTNTSSTSVNDQSSALNAYTVATAGIANSHIEVNNRDYSPPKLTITVNGSTSLVGGDSLTFSAPLTRAVDNISLALRTGGFITSSSGVGLQTCPNGNSIINTGGTDTGWGCWGSPGTVTNVTGTANEITVANGGTTPALSIAAAFDISQKTSTKSMKTGTALPATCGVGELYYKTDATAGQNIHSCTATNTWTQHTGVSAATVGPALYMAGTGTANAHAGCPTPSVGALATGQLLYLAAAATNTGAATFNLCALGVKNIVNADGTTLQAGAIQQATAGNPGYAGMMYSAGCDCFQLLTPNVPLLPAQSSATKNLYARSNGSTVNWASPWNPGSGRRVAAFIANGYNADVTANGTGFGAIFLVNSASGGNSAAGSGGVTGSEYPYVRLTTGALAGNDVFINNYPNTKVWKSGRNLVFDDVIRLSATTNIRVWNGFTSSDTASIVTANTEPAGGIKFRYSTGVPDTAWQCVMSNAGVSTTVSSGVAPTLNQMRFQIIADDTANTVRWYIDGVEVCTSFAMTNYPAATAMQQLASVATLEAAAKSLDVAYMYLEADK